jgi:phosphohistidine phosphatase
MLAKRNGDTNSCAVASRSELSERGNMELIVWRHAEAEDSSPDVARKLTTKGEKQAQKMASWLKERIKKPARILVSPAVRTQQTGTALSAKFETSTEVGIGASAERILRAAGWPDAKGTVLVVGHQPTLGQLAATLLTGQESDWEIKKGAVWWFSTSVEGSDPVTALRAMITPKDV